LAAGPLQAQEKDKDKDGMQRLVIYNGAVRTVQYYGGDAAAARDRSRNENAVSLADLAQDLRALYLRNESEFERFRHHMQMLLYGYTTTYGYSQYPSGVFEPYRAYPWWGGGYGWGGGWGGVAAGLGVTTYGLQNGVGDEGALKRELILGVGGAAPERKPKE
jgi:hypothetical protein